METPVLSVLREPGNDDLPLPAYQSDGASGLDVRAAVREPIRIEPGARSLVPTGLRMAVPPGFEIQVRPRSGLALKHGIIVVNSPGTVDADYRGEIQVILGNLSRDAFVVERGDRIAQLVVQRVERALVREVRELPETARGAGGFGSSGSR